MRNTQKTVRDAGEAARGERGFAIIIVMLLLLVGLAFGAAAVAETLDSSDAANRQSRLERAQAAADAGIQSVIYDQADSPNAILSTYNLNGGPLGISAPFLDCTVAELNGSALTGTLADLGVGVGSVCPPSATTSGTAGTTVPVQSDGDHAYDEAEFIPDQQTPVGGGETILYPKIVSLGWDDKGNSNNTDNHIVYDREEAILAPIAPLQAVEAEGNLTLNGISLLGINVAGVVNGDIQAAGSITAPTALVMADLTGSSILGTVTYGDSYTGPALTLGAGLFHVTPPQRYPITISTPKVDCEPSGETVNDCSGLGSYYTASTDSISMSSGTLTIAPGDYVFCNFNVTGGTINATATSSSAPVRIFIDSPNSTRCKSDGVSHQGNLNAANGFNNSLFGTLGSALAASGLQIYVVGDQNATDPYDDATTVNIGASATGSLTGCGALNLLPCISPVTQAMIVYAPTSQTTVNTGVCILGNVICTGGVFEGNIIGDNVTISAATITQDLQLTSFPLYNGVNAIHPIAYKQCTAVTSLAGLAASPASTAAATDLSGC
jgi:hypothetical protein